METTKICVFFSRISKLCARRANSCFFSSLPPSPYLIVGGGHMAGVEIPEGILVKPVFLDPKTKDKTVFGRESLIPKWVSVGVGASQGWIMRKESSKLYLTEVYKPWVSSPRVLSLPDNFSFAREKIVSLSVSSSDPVVDDDCLVCTNFDDFSLSVCRPRDSKWTHIQDDGLAGLLPAKTITYSKRYKAFYFTSRNGFFLGSVDLSNRNDYKLKYHHLRLRNLPLEIVKKWNKIHDTCRMTQHLVDSLSGDLFFILWYTSYTVEPAENYDDGCVKETLIKPERFLVFREDERTKNFNYTEDIGDLCIFLGMNEPFSVSANLFPGLRPNSIYYTYPLFGPEMGCYSLASAKTRCLTSNSLMRHGSFWIHPADAFA